MKDSDPLSDRLHQWRVTPEIPARFQADVWSRIRDRADAESATGLRAFLDWLLPARPTWRYATAAALTVALAASTLGTVTAHRANDRVRMDLAESYAASIDPYVRVAGHSPR